MLGWYFCIYRKTAGAELNSPYSRQTPIAKWQATLGGMTWIDRLVDEGKAKSLGGDGYPYRFEMMVRELKTVLQNAPPHSKWRWVFEDGGAMPSYGAGLDSIDRKELTTCDPEEWLHVEVWDES